MIDIIHELNLVLQKLQARKDSLGRDENARYLAIAITELEKLIAWISTYLPEI